MPSSKGPTEPIARGNLLQSNETIGLTQTISLYNDSLFHHFVHCSGSKPVELFTHNATELELIMLYDALGNQTGGNHNAMSITEKKKNQIKNV